MRVKDALAGEGTPSADATAAARDFDINLFRLCASARLAQHLILRHLPRVLYLDSDTVTMCDIGRLWDVMDEFEDGQALGMALEDPTNGTEAWRDYYGRAGLPTYPAGGLNSGVLLMDIRALRRAYRSIAEYWKEVLDINSGGLYLPLVPEYKDMYHFGDQDLINILLLRRPSLLYVLRWHTRLLGFSDVPCLWHYNDQRWRESKNDPERPVNTAFKYARDWIMPVPT